MTYIFTGVLSEQLPSVTFPEDTNELVFREIDHPELKFGVLFPQQADEQIDTPNEKTEELVRHLGEYELSSGIWIYYLCWGGDLETVATATFKNSIIDMNSYCIYEDISYEDLFNIFNNFNILIEQNGHFEPFGRNYWGEYGY